MEKCMSKTKAKTAVKSNSEMNAVGKVNVNMRVKTVKPKVAVYKDKQTRTQIFQTISENTRLNKSQIEGIFDGIEN